MGLPKKIVGFLGVLALLSAGAIYFWFHGKPAAPSENPLGNVDVSNLTTIIVSNQSSTTTLRQENGKWMITDPVQDAADPVVMDRMVVAIKSFTVGSIVSENPSKYPTFLLDEAQAGRLQVYVKGDKKVLDMFVGKIVTGPSDSFIRFDGNVPVYIASDLPNYLFRRGTKDFRLARLLPVNTPDIQSLKLESGKKQWSIAQSSDVWINETTGMPVDSAWKDRLMQSLEGLFAADFESGEAVPEDMGLDNPFLKISVNTANGPLSFSIGNKAKPETRYVIMYGDVRYAQTEGRPAVMIIHSNLANDLISHFDSLK